MLLSMLFIAYTIKDSKRLQKIKKYLLLLHLKINIYGLYEQEIDVFGSTHDGAAFGKRSEKSVKLSYI